MYKTHESDIVHPAMAQWLTEHGYQYEREKRLGQSHADFYAWNDHGERLLVECKTSALYLKTAIDQLAKYSRLLNVDTHPAIALPTPAVSQEVVKQCSEAGISIIPLDIEIPEMVKATTFWPKALYDVLRRMAYDQDVKFSEIVRRIALDNPQVQQTAQSMGIDLAEAKVDQPGGNVRQRKQE